MQTHHHIHNLRICLHLAPETHHLYVASVILQFQLGVHAQNVASITTQDQSQRRGGMIEVQPTRLPAEPYNHYSAKNCYLRQNYQPGHSPFKEDEGKTYKDGDPPWCSPPAGARAASSSSKVTYMENHGNSDASRSSIQVRWNIYIYMCIS